MNDKARKCGALPALNDDREGEGEILSSASDAELARWSCGCVRDVGDVPGPR